MTFTLEVDFLGNGTWRPYKRSACGTTAIGTHTFPDGFSATGFASARTPLAKRRSTLFTTDACASCSGVGKVDALPYLSLKSPSAILRVLYGEFSVSRPGLHGAYKSLYGRPALVGYNPGTQSVGLLFRPLRSFRVSL